MPGADCGVVDVVVVVVVVAADVVVVGVVNDAIGSVDDTVVVGAVVVFVLVVVGVVVDVVVIVVVVVAIVVVWIVDIMHPTRVRHSQNCCACAQFCGQCFEMISYTPCLVLRYNSAHSHQEFVFRCNTKLVINHMNCVSHHFVRLGVDSSGGSPTNLLLRRILSLVERNSNLDDSFLLTMFEVVLVCSFALEWWRKAGCSQSRCGGSCQNDNRCANTYMLVSPVRIPISVAM